MGKYIISINQFADFSKGTDAKKRSIIKQQKTPNTFKMSYYQMPKARIKKSFENNGDVQPVLDGINELQKRVLTKPRQINDRTVSLEAMEKFLKMQIPKIFKDMDYEILKKPKIRTLEISGVDVIVSPDLIVKVEIDGVIHYGGVKIHIAKGSKFDSRQQRYVATAIHNYLETVVASEDEVVLPEMCLSVDVFGAGIISAPNDLESYIRDMEVICEEIKTLWFAA